MLKPAGEALVGGLKSAMAGLSTWIQQNGPTVMKDLTALWDIAKPAVEGFGVALKLGVDQVTFWVNAFSSLIDAVKSFSDYMADKVMSTFASLSSAVDEAWQTLKGGFDTALHDATTVFDALDTAGHNIVTFFENLPGTIGKAFDAIPGLLKDAFSNIGSDISSWLSNIHIPGFAGGGPLNAPGPKGKDSALFWGAAGEHVLTANDVDAMGGHAGVHAFRNALHRADGGAVGPDVRAAMSMVGTPYSQGARDDCSGMVGRVINSAMGMPNSSLPTTRNMGQWLQERGFKQGLGGMGAMSVGWYNHGPNPNDGHTAMTLSDGENAESGGSHGNFLIGSGAAGASNSEFDNHMFLPISAAYGEGSPFGGVAPGVGGGAAGGVGGSSGGGGGVSGGASGGIPAGSTAGTGPNGEAGYYTPDQKKVDAAQSKLDKDNDDLKRLQDQQKAS